YAYSSYEYTNQSRISSNIGCLAFKNRPRGKLGIKSKNPSVVVMLGGAPVSREVAELFSADGYAENAGNAVQEAIKIITQLRDIGPKECLAN
ncbi:MAG: hypothetical protein WBG50_04380, partial [Desulfomonilaceae bacterium]